MPAMVMSMMKTIMKFMIKSALWIIRIIESLLETLEKKDRPKIKRPMMNEAKVEPHENPIDQGRNEIPVKEEEIPNPAPPQVNQTKGAQ